MSLAFLEERDGAIVKAENNATGMMVVSNKKIAVSNEPGKPLPNAGSPGTHVFAIPSSLLARNLTNAPGAFVRF